MDPKKLKRDPKRVQAALSITAGGQVITAKPCRIYIPTRYAEKQLAHIGTEVHILGIYALVMEDSYYAVSLANAMKRIEPSTINTVSIDDNEYYEFVFEAGDTVIADINLVINDTLPYHINDEIIAKGRIPWYLTYEDLGSLFDSAEKYAGVRLGANDAVLEMIASSIARSEKDPRVYYRQSVDTQEDVKNTEPLFIAFRNISYGATNTTAKLMGSYFEASMTSALVNPSEKLEDIEELLRR